MPNSDVAAGLAGLQAWSEPIIFDRLLDVYRRRVGVGAKAWGLARLHARTWKAAISGDFGGFEAARSDLLAELGEQFLTSEDAADADAEILVELLEIVMARFQRSASTARAYHLALIALAGRLTPQPAAVAA
jgi:hypothetical protein